MKLHLDHTQRIHLVTVLDLLECKGRREAWEICKLQERIDLDESERQAVDFRKDRTPDGQEYARWDAGKSIEPRDYDLSEEDINRICRALDGVPLVLGRDRWYRALQAQLPEPVQSNEREYGGAASGEVDQSAAAPRNEISRQEPELVPVAKTRRK